MLATQKKMPLASTHLSTPPAHPSGVLDEPEDIYRGFFGMIARQVGRKPFYLGLHVSKTLVDMWCTQEKRDVFTAAKEAVDIVRKEGQAHLIAPILLYIAGHDFGGLVLDSDQAEIVRKFAALIMGKEQAQ